MRYTIKLAPTVLALTILLAGMTPSSVLASTDKRGPLQTEDPPMQVIDGTSNTRSR